MTALYVYSKYALTKKYITIKGEKDYAYAKDSLVLSSACFFLILLFFFSIFMFFFGQNNVQLNASTILYSLKYPLTFGTLTLLVLTPLVHIIS